MRVLWEVCDAFFECWLEWSIFWPSAWVIWPITTPKNPGFNSEMVCSTNRREIVKDIKIPSSTVFYGNFVMLFLSASFLLLAAFWRRLPVFLLLFWPPFLLPFVAFGVLSATVCWFLGVSVMLFLLLVATFLPLYVVFFKLYLLF